MTLSSVAREFRQLRALLDGVAQIDWRHPSWWGLVAGTVAIEALPASQHADSVYLTSNGGPRADTFMACVDTPVDLAGRIAGAVVRARAAAQAIVELDGHYPAQPLLSYLDVGSAVVRVRPVANPYTVVFATPVGAFVAELSRGGEGDAALVRELASAYVRAPDATGVLRRVDVAASQPVAAAIAVSLFYEELGTARHLHRRVWSVGGGPWLGIGFADGYQLVTTSHTVVDGHGHAQIARRIFEAGDSGSAGSIAAAAARRVVGQAAAMPGPRLPCAQTLGVAMSTLPVPVRLPELVYATAATLERFHRRGWSTRRLRNARYTPTLQVPIAPGARDDPARYRRRVVPGLLSVAMRDGELEPFAAFRERLPRFVAREAQRAGALTRMRAAAARIALTERMVRRALDTGATPKPWLPPVAVLAGRGCVSVLRFPADQQPRCAMYAASAPALDATSLDPSGSTVVTVVDTAQGLSLTVSGTGAAGTAAGATLFLDQLEQALPGNEGRLRPPVAHYT